MILNYNFRQIQNNALANNTFQDVTKNKYQTGMGFSR